MEWLEILKTMGIGAVALLLLLMALSVYIHVWEAIASAFGVPGDERRFWFIIILGFALPFFVLLSHVI